MLCNLYCPPIADTTTRMARAREAFRKAVVTCAVPLDSTALDSPPPLAIRSQIFTRVPDRECRRSMHPSLLPISFWNMTTTDWLITGPFQICMTSRTTQHRSPFGQFDRVSWETTERVERPHPRSCRRQSFADCWEYNYLQVMLGLDRSRRDSLQKQLMSPVLSIEKAFDAAVDGLDHTGLAKLVLNWIYHRHGPTYKYVRTYVHFIIER